MGNFAPLILALAIISLAFIYLMFTKNESLKRGAPSLLTTIGIFCTFIGVSWGLYNFKTKDIDLINSIDSLLQGLKFAFIPSALGVLFSIITKYKDLSQDVSFLPHENPTLKALNKIITLLESKTNYKNNLHNLTHKELVEDFGSFIVHHETHYAILFSYVSGRLPTIIAKVKEEEAKLILDLAKLIGLPLIENKFLATECYGYTESNNMPKHLVKPLGEVIGKHYKLIKPFIRSHNSPLVNTKSKDGESLPQAVEENSVVENNRLSNSDNFLADSDDFLDDSLDLMEED